VWYRNHATYVRDFPISIDIQLGFVTEIRLNQKHGNARKHSELYFGISNFLEMKGRSKREFSSSHAEDLWNLGSKPQEGRQARESQANYLDGLHSEEHL
jgi:hypothetical protein